jgi:asparagine N-glycosylation enzyme membrane subunit Stt3
MKNFIDLKSFLLSLIICASISLGASYFFGFSFLPTFGITVIAVLINGFVATWEDEQIGGFNNPKVENQDRNKE